MGICRKGLRGSTGYGGLGAAVLGTVGLALPLWSAGAWAQTDAGTANAENSATSERSGHAGSSRLGSSTLEPLVVQGNEINSSMAPTTGYSADATQAATKTDTPLIQTPQAIDVVPREQIEDQGARTINNALRYTPGVFTGLSGSSSRQTVASLRGFPGGDINNFFMDGLRIANDPGAFTNIQIDPFFLERIDVVKGATSVLYGRAQPGGLVNYVTKKPLDEQQGLVRIYGGSFDTYGAGLDVTGPLPNADLGNYRVIVGAETSETQYDVVERERLTIMPQVSFDLAEDTSLLLQAYIQRDPEGGFHGSVPYSISADDSRFGRTVDDSWVDVAADYETFERDINLFSFHLEHEVNDSVTIQSKGRYTDATTYVEQLFQNGFIQNADPASTLTRSFTRADEQLKGFAWDNQAQVRFDTGPVKHRLLAGFGYQDRENLVFGASGTATNLDAFDPNYYGPGITSDDSFGAPNERKVQEFGFYLQDQLEWNNFHLALNARQDYLRRDYLNGETGFRAESDDNELTTRAALLYESKWGVSPYVSYSEGFNPSGYVLSRFSEVDPAPPIKSHQYEAGLKYQPPGIDALFTVAVYDLTQENVQQRLFVSPPRFVGVGDVNSQGIELSARADLTDRLNVIASYSKSSVEYQSTNEARGIVEGNTFTRTPDELASAWAKYDLTPGIDVGAGVRHVGESFADAANTITVDDFTIADAMVNVDLGAYSNTLEGASFRVNANNVFDKKYVEACFSPTYCYFGYSREIIGTLDYRF